METEFERRQGVLTYSDNSPPEITVDINKDIVKIGIMKKTIIEKQGEKRVFDNLNSYVKNPVYNLASIAVEISNQETDYCYFEYVGYSILYPRYKINYYSI